MLPSIEQTEPARTLIVPRVGPLAAPSRLRFLLPWLVFGAVAVVVIGGTSLWSVALRTSAAGGAAPGAAGIDTGPAPVVAAGPPSAAALPTTPAAASASTSAAFTPVHSPVPRPRAVAPPPAPAAAPTSAVPQREAVPTTSTGPAVCADPGAEPPSCTATSAPALRSPVRAASTTATKAASR